MASLSSLENQLAVDIQGTYLTGMICSIRASDKVITGDFMRENAPQSAMRHYIREESRDCASLFIFVGLTVILYEACTKHLNS